MTTENNRNDNIGGSRVPQRANTSAPQGRSNAGAQNGTQTKRPTKRRRKKKKRLKIFRIFLLLLLLAILIAGGMVVKYVLGIVSKAPKIDPQNVLGTLSQNSVIYDQNGNLIEQIIDPTENREIVPLSKMPKHLQEAFIAIEDKRFKEHSGIDITRILGALFSNVKSGDMKGQGASTITQQLVKNLYLSNLKSLERKITEAYLALQMERELSKDQILENYLNTIGLGGNINGVQAAAYAYFSKDVSELTIAESALLAAAPKGPAYSPYKRYSLESLGGVPKEDILGYVYVDSVQYACIYNELAIERQRQVLAEMLDQEKITKAQYDAAIAVDMRTAIKPGIKKIEGVTANNFTDYVKEQVIEDLMKENDLTYEEAQQYLFKGGLSIYSTMDVKMQQTIENMYLNFGEIFLGGPVPESKPLAQNWTGFRWIGGKPYGTLDSNANILNNSGNVLYFKYENMLNEKRNLYLWPNEYTIDEEGNLIISSNKFTPLQSFVDIVDCYTIDEKNQLVIHNIGGLSIGDNYKIIEQENGKRSFLIPKSYLDEHEDLYIIGAEDVLIFNNEYYKYDEDGIIQPQSAAVVMDYRTGQVKALIGGRDIEGNKTFNRAVHAARQPGSTIKPVGVYIAALDRGYNAASVFDDVPMYDSTGYRWPKNWYEQFYSYQFYHKGLVTMRYAIQQSLNTIPVVVAEKLGLNTVVEYFDKLGLVDLKNPENDTFVTPEEDGVINDMNPSAIALGGLSKGFSPLKMTAAYGTIANQGVYIEPICYTRVENRDGTVILDNKAKSEVAVVPEVAFILQDILVSGVTGAHGLAGAARIQNNDIEMAAKTGTTQDNGDFWCLGFSPYYVAGVWVGNDNPTVKLSETSTATARLLGALMTAIHEGLEPAKFEINNNVVRANVCKCSGLLPNEYCSQDPRGSQIISEYFIRGTVPTETCNCHVKVKVCSDSLKLPTENCPEDKIIEKIVITRPELYDPYKNPFDDKTPAVEKLYQAYLLYKQVLLDINSGMSSQDILDLYPGLVTLKVTKVDSNTTPDNPDSGNSGEGGSDIVESEDETGNNEDEDRDYVVVEDKKQKETIEIETVHGFTIEQLTYRIIYTEDFDYQMPIDACNYHTIYHKSTSGSGNKDDSIIESPDNPEEGGDAGGEGGDTGGEGGDTGGEGGDAGGEGGDTGGEGGDTGGEGGDTGGEGGDTGGEGGDTGGEGGN